MPERIEDLGMNDLAEINLCAVAITRILATKAEMGAAESKSIEGLLATANLVAKFVALMNKEGISPRDMAMAAATLVGTLVTKAAEKKRSSGNERN